MRPSRSVEAPGESQGRYRKVRPRWWADVSTQRLTTAQKLVALYCLTGPQSNGIGLYRLSPAQAAEDLGEDFAEGFTEAFTEACRIHGWRFDRVARVLWIPSWVTENPPQSPNVVKSWHGQLDQVPDCSLKHEAIQALAETLKGFGQAFAQAFGKAFTEDPPKVLPNQEQEQDQEQERSKHTSSRTNGHHANGHALAASDAARVSLPLKARPQKTEAVVSEPIAGPPDDGFAAFWARYPRKVAQAAARKSWGALKPSPALAARILAGLEAWCQSRTWLDAMQDPERRHIPHAATWLNQRRWEEGPVAADPHSMTRKDEPVMQKELIRLLDAAGVNRQHRAIYFHGASVTSDTTTGVATLIVPNEKTRASIERSFSEVLEAAVVAQGGRTLRIVGSAAA